jgi:hypothetical protein
MFAKNQNSGHNLISLTASMRRRIGFAEISSTSAAEMGLPIGLVVREWNGAATVDVFARCQDLYWRFQTQINSYQLDAAYRTRIVRKKGLSGSTERCGRECDKREPISL